MSEVWLVLAVGCIAGAILLFGIFFDLSQSERRRAVRMLESQVSGTSSENVNLREQHLSESFGSRIIVPVVAGATRVARRITPIDARDRLARKLLLAGTPAGWDAERILAFKIIGLVSGVVLALVVSSVIGDVTPFIRIVLFGLLGFVGFVAPDSMLNRRVDERQREILRTLSDTLDLLTISVEAGLSLNAAIAQVVQNVPGVLSSEFARMLQEIQLGVPRADAFRNLAERTDVEELNAFALAMIQADVFGVSIASVLRTQAQQLRIKRRQRAEAKAQQTPVKIVFPLILCILPALFVVIVGPGAIQIWEQFINA
jgi:tight adherence protein C